MYQGISQQKNDILDKNKRIYHMLSNKIGKPSKVQILLLYTSGQNGEGGGTKKIIKQSENPQTKKL